ncbi:unnamed protein product [Dictyota dichotoma]|uniref:Ribosomal protein L5 n=1 Tax=Dictyota dichotoma TaxID=2876 RepID=Q2TUC2_DICDH|nr:ribosomal protein L5 [Dictyota dichotoma]AAS79073.1 ribosomal protein L5 [Dictyota dichotoma]
MTPFLRIHYDNVVQKDLVLTTHPRVYMEIVKPTKLLLFTRKISTDDYSVLASVLALECVSQQKPWLLRSGTLISRKVIGCKITLRNKNLYKFLFNLNFRVLPRTKQFEGFRFLGCSDIFAFSLRDMLSFEELVPFIKFFGDLGYLHCQLHCYTKNNNDMLLFGRSIFLCML